MTTVDLHMHSCYSDDGEFTPEELLKKCCKAGIRTAAITDHNSVSGIAEGVKAAANYGVSLIPGIEMDCTIDQVNLHILGYFIDYENPEFKQVEENLFSQEREASRRRIELVQSLGIMIDETKAYELAYKGMVNGEVIAEAALSDERNKNNPLLMPYRNGQIRNDNPYVNFYWDFCAQGKPAYVELNFPTLAETVKLIRSSGGVAVLAHPGNNISEDEALLKKIIDSGVCGIEAYSSYHNKAQTAFYLEAAKKLGLPITCGSDYHGKIKPSIKLGNIQCAIEDEQLIVNLKKFIIH